MNNLKQLNRSPLWTWLAIGVVGTLVLAALFFILFQDWLIEPGFRKFGAAAARTHPATQNGWRTMPAGSWPWGRGPDRGNGGGYACLRWNSHVESWDTLYGAVCCLSDTDGAALWVRTLLRFGAPAPSETCVASCQIVASTDLGNSWTVIRDYGGEDFNGVDKIPLPSWARRARRVQFAWICHAYDTLNLRYWCIDDIGLQQKHLHAGDVAIGQVLQPLAGQVVPPTSEFTAEVMVHNLGSTAESTTVWVLLDGLEIAARRLAIPKHGRVPMEFKVNGEVDDDGLVLEHRRTNRPYRSSDNLDLGPGPHALTFVAQTEFDEEPGNDSLGIEFTVAGEFWQRLPGEYPMPRATVRKGIAAAGDELGAVYVRNPGNPGTSGEALMRLFMTYRLPHGNWDRLPGFEPYLQAMPTERPTLGGAAVVNDSLFFCQLNDSGPLMKYDTATRLWSVTSYPTSAALRLGVKADLASGVCWGGRDRVYVLGNHDFYGYSIRADTWWVIRRHPAYKTASEFPDTCCDMGDIAFLNGSLYAVAANRSLIEYNIDFDAWGSPRCMPGTGRLNVCRLAADPDGGRLYILATHDGDRARFLAYDVERDSWILDLPQPEWIARGYALLPGAILTRAGRYLVAANGRETAIYMFNLPPAESPERGQREDWGMPPMPREPVRGRVPKRR